MRFWKVTATCQTQTPDIYRASGDPRTSLRVFVRFLRKMPRRNTRGGCALTSDGLDSSFRRLARTCIVYTLQIKHLGQTSETACLRSRLGRLKSFLCQKVTFRGTRLALSQQTHLGKDVHRLHGGKKEREGDGEECGEGWREGRERGILQIY